MTQRTIRKLRMKTIVIKIESSVDKISYNLGTIKKG